MRSEISFVLDNRIETINFDINCPWSPTTTVLNYLRGIPGKRGVKEGCAEGDCGACTVVLAEADHEGNLIYNVYNSCLIFLPKLHGKQLLTVENLKSENGSLHPVQQALVNSHGSQCGFCTPGIVMALFAYYKNANHFSREKAESVLAGNLCRCTGYQPVLEAAREIIENKKQDLFDEQASETSAMLRKIPKSSIEIKTENEKYLLPANLAELLQQKKRFSNAEIINGSTDVALRVTKNHEQLNNLIDISQVEDLKFIKEQADYFCIGSGITINRLAELAEKQFPAIHDMCSVFGSHQIRNIATIGGSLGSASPISDLTPVLIAYNAVVVLESLQGVRRLPLEEFITGYRKTVINKNEIIKGIHIPKIKNGIVVKYYKVSKRREVDIATVSAGFRLELDDKEMVSSCILAYGGMAEITRRAAKAEEFIIGKKWTRETIEDARAILRDEFTPISDARSGAEFRNIAAANLLLKFWDELK